MPLADATATRVVSTEVIEHVDDPRQFLAELVRVGQPGALYLLSVPHPTSEDLQKDFAADEYFRKPNHIRVLGEELPRIVDAVRGPGYRPGARIIIADIDAEKIARTRERLADTPARELECLVSDCDPLPLADATATRVVSTEVIEHVDDPRQFLAELVRVGQPGALYLLSVPHPTSEDLQKDFAADEYFRKPNHIRVLGEEQFAALVREAGLEILSHSRYGFYWSLWMLLFWEAKVDFGNPDHPLLEHWARTWQALLDSPRGPAIKQALDAVVAKSQVIIARKPAQA
ncbi:methyltransferase domain-containing protein [Pseudomonas aeruginosa]